MDREFRFAYGRGMSAIRLPGNWPVEVVQPAAGDAVGSAAEILTAALDSPVGSPRLEDIVVPGQTAAVIISDRTRLWQRPDVAAATVISRLEGAGVAARDISIVVATGLHRPLAPEELKTLVGQKTYDRVAVYTHDCDGTDQLCHIGQDGSGHPIWINRRVVEADRRIVTGGIAFHNLAGYSGGRKAILPGVAGRRVIQTNHALAFDDNFELKPCVGKGRLEGNPVAAAMAEAAMRVGVDFSLNVVVDAKNRIVKATAGDVDRALLEGCTAAGRASAAPYRKKAELILANVGGFPRDGELYQCVKALEHATMASEEGAIILLSAACEEGVGPSSWISWWRFGGPRQLARRLKEDFDFTGFVALKLMNLQRRFKIALVSRLDSELVGALGFHPLGSMQEAVDWAHDQLPRPRHVILMPAAGSAIPSGPTN